MTARTWGARARPARPTHAVPRQSGPRLAGVVVLAMVAGLLGLMTPTADAAPGPAPAPRDPTVLSKVHTDAVSTFLDGDRLALGTKADTPDTGTRYDPAAVWFHVDDASQQVVPAGQEFVAPAGTQVWIAPETNPGGRELWAGFSTEGVPAGTIAGDSTSFTLTDVRAPAGGSVEVWTGGGATPVIRRWSSDEDHKTFTLGRTHSHANWAFTRPGTYELDVRATVTLGSTPVSATASYTFVVGALPEQAATSTTLTASAESVTQGSAVTLSARVSPTTATGAVEFRRGAMVLGHDPVRDGAAALTVSDLPVGTHQVTAVFVPTTADLAAASTSAPVDVTVTDETGAPFTVTGTEGAFQPGATMQARVAGATLEQGQEIQWRMRPAGTTYTGTVLSRFVPETDTDAARAGRLDLVMQASYDGYQLQAALVQGDQTLSTTPWTPTISVPDAVEPLSLGYTGPTPFHPGDTATLPVTGRELAADESLRVVLQPALGHFNLWNPAGPGYEALDARTFAFEPPGTTVPPLALQVVRDGIVVAQSDPLGVRTASYEFFFEGMQPLYRAGQTFRASMRVSPDLADRVTYSWAMYDDYENPLQVTSGDAGRRFEMPVTAAMDGKRMFIQANVVYPSGGKTLLGGAYPYLTVTDQQGRIFLFSSLSEHYHQGATVDLQLTADPGLAEGDSIAWQWRWPGQDWETLPGAAGLDHQLVAEQAMDGLEVRATLTSDDPQQAPHVAGPVTVQVDDHGIPATQVPTVGGETGYTAGEPLALRLELPEDGRTVLTEHRWERRSAGSQEWTAVAGQTGPRLTTITTADDDGASYRVSILRPGGQVAYGPSDPVMVTVSETSQPSFGFAALSEAYRSGETIELVLEADPALAPDDFLFWEWSFTGTDEWSWMPGADGAVRRVTAEQGLDGVRVRVTRYPSSGLPAVTEPVTIRVDDQGAPAGQVPSVGGPTSFVAGEGLALRVVLPQDGQSVLVDHRWERRAAGSAEWTVVDGQTGAELASAATLADDGASYRVSIVKPGGALAYGPSQPVTVRVAPETTTAFGLAGITASYEVGEVLRTRVVGRVLTEGQTWRFAVRPAGSTGDGSTFYGDGDYTATQEGRLRQLLDAGHDGYQVRARLREGGAFVAGGDTGWVSIDVTTNDAPLRMSFPEGPHHTGAVITVPFAGQVAGGEAVRLVYRQKGSTWYEANHASVGQGVVRFLPQWALGDVELALQKIRGGVAVSVSEPVARTIAQREAIVQGVQGVYRVGQTLTASATVFPDLAGLTYRWALVDADYHLTVLESGDDAESLSVELPMTAGLDEADLFFEAYVDHPEHGRVYAASWNTELRVSSAAPDEQLVFFKSLGGHYHQGYTIDLEVVADPALDAGDTLSWEWRWPATDWAPFPGPSGLKHQLVSEQALDGVQVRATLHPGDSTQTLTTEPVTIHNDDHGGAARQRPTVGGDLAAVEGETVTLTRELPENGPTVLTGHRWEQKTGDGDWTVVDDQAGAELSFPATPAEDGAQYRVSILKPDDQVAYGPSPAVTLEVEPGLTPPPTAVPTTVTVDPVRMTYGRAARLPVSVAPGATGSVLVDLGGTRQVSAPLVAGRAVVGLPAGSLAPGRHTVRVSYAGVEDAFEPSQGAGSVRVVRARPTLKVARPARVGPGGAVRVRVTVQAPSAAVAGRVRVRMAGQERIVAVDEAGRATGRFRLPRTAAPGPRTVWVTYLGSRYLLPVRTHTEVRVTR